MVAGGDHTQQNLELLEEGVTKLGYDHSVDVIPGGEKTRGINMLKYFEKNMKLKNEHLRVFIAEMFGTWLLLAFGLGSVAQLTFIGSTNPISVHLAFGIAVIVAIIVTGKASGAHLNPAVSFCMLITGRMSFFHFIIYCVAQFAGSFLGALFIYGIYADAFKKFFHGHESDEERMFEAAKIFATYPQPELTSLGALVDQVCATALLIIFIMAINDPRNERLSHEGKTVLVGMVIVLLGFSFAYNCGYPINPARDLAPRLFSAMIWGSRPFTEGNYHFWIPVVGPMIGSLVGTVFYALVVSNHWP